MKAKFIFIISLITICISSCKKEEKSDEIQLRWQGFLDVLKQKNVTEFKEYASDTIRCYMCIENTEHERKVIEYLRDNDSTWYDKIYDEKIYLPINKFIEEDFDLIFTEDFVELLKNSETIFSKREFDEYGVATSNGGYEILVTTTKPTLGHEGGQHDFSFKKINGKYILSEISTIP